MRRVKGSSSVGTAFPLVFDDLTPSKDIKKFEDIVKSYWEVWWQPDYVFPQIVVSSNTENLPEWAKSRVKHIDFDVHFAPDENARQRLNDIFSRPNGVFSWFSALYLQGLSSVEVFHDDELSLARTSMRRLYEYVGRELPVFFPHEPLEKLFDPGQRRWRDLLDRMQLAKVRWEKDRAYIEFSDAMQYREIQAYQGYLPQTIKNRLRGKTLIIDSRRAFEVWSAGNDAAGRHDPIVVGGERTVGHPRVETDVVGGDDQQRIHQEGATVGSTAGGVRRLGRRMSPPSATSSLRMVTTTPGDDSVEPPRERGK